MVKTPKPSEAAPFDAELALLGQIELDPGVYPADKLAEQRRLGLDLARAMLAERPDDPSAQQLVQTMESEVSRYQNVPQPPSSE